MDSPSLFSKDNSILGSANMEEATLSLDDLTTFTSNINFSGPVKTTEQLRQGLIASMGPEQGQKMYDEFIKSVISMSINTLKKEIERAQRAAKRMRAVYRE